MTQPPWTAPGAGTPPGEPGTAPPPPPPPPAAGGSAWQGVGGAGADGWSGPGGWGGTAAAQPAQPSAPQPPAVPDPFAAPTADVLPLGTALPGGQYQYGAPPGSWGPAPTWPTTPPNDPLAIASLAIGIGSMVLGFLFAPFALLAPVALGLGVWALVRIRRSGAPGRGMAIAGVVLGAVATLGLLAMATIIGFFVTAGLAGGGW